MRHGTSSRRQRNRGNGGRRGNKPRMQIYDSNGPDVRIRGTAHQVAEKYEALAKDAASSGDIILSESYLQHAEHYQRIIINNRKDSPSSEQGARDNERPVSQSAQTEDSPDDDLSLPSSILGVPPKEESKEKSRERTAELTTS